MQSVDKGWEMSKIEEAIIKLKEVITHYEIYKTKHILLDVIELLVSELEPTKPHVEERRKKMRRCDRCDYWRTGVKGIQKGFGECHLRPPTVIAGMQAAIAVWPVTSGDDFCGSFNPAMEREKERPENPKIRGGRITRPIDPIERPSDRMSREMKESLVRNEEVMRDDS
jgi:hypothetical protein